VIIFISVYFVMTKSGNFWIHPRMCLSEDFVRLDLRKEDMVGGVD